MDGRFEEALALLRRLTGDPRSEFRPDQFEAIDRVVGQRQRLLLVQRTGWGKSAVYFIATRMLRDRGYGPTLLISPLLALMRNQIDAAERMGVRARTINSSNRADWQDVEAQLGASQIDLLLVAPERLANQQFRSDVLPQVGERSGLLVIDEAHCISDWGHDFRPDYRRIVRVLDQLPSGVPVLCCTATANDRVVEDINTQLGAGLVTIRGPLARDGLRLAVLELPSQGQRLAWLAENLPKLPGTGIVYCLTVRDTTRVAGWLRANGIPAEDYSGQTEADKRPSVEEALLANDLKVVVATSALGMGFDKPDLGFVIHYQSPGSPIAYYQQVGRAGRALPESWGILMSGREDSDIQDYFIQTAFPPPGLAAWVVRFLEERSVVTKTNEILAVANVRPVQLGKLLKILEVERAVQKVGGGWLRTLRPWKYDDETVRLVTGQRRAEQGQMREYLESSSCRMQLLRQYLDDSGDPCGICDNCTGLSFPSPSQATVLRAISYLRSAEMRIEPRRRLPIGGNIPQDQRIETGRVLSLWQDGGWGRLVQRGKQIGGRFDQRLVVAAADLITERWRPDPPPTWVTFVPSLRTAELVPDFASQLAEALGVPCLEVLSKRCHTEPQKSMQNSPKQYANVSEAFQVQPPVRQEPVLLVDDAVDSRWTLTVVGRELRKVGVPIVYPFALADTSGRSGR